MRKAIVLTCLVPLLLGNRSYGDHFPNSKASSRTAVSSGVPSPDEVSRFYGATIEQDPYAKQHWNYLASNEHFNHLFETGLPKGGGAYVAIGTFRGLNVASAGKVSHLFLVDIDSGATVFNRLNLQLIGYAKNRLEYLSFLFTGTKQAALEDAARNGELSFEDFVERLAERVPKNILDKWKALGVKISDEDATLLSPKTFIPNYLDLSNYLASTMAAEVSRYGMYRVENETFMGNDERFAAIRKMILDRKVTVLAGDVAGDTTFKSVGEALRARGMKVAAVDVSNVPDYLEPAQTKKTISNILSLPFHDQGRVFYTFQGAISPEALRNWGYISVHPYHLDSRKTFVGSKHGGSAPFKARNGTDAPLTLDPKNPKPHQMFFTPSDAPSEQTLR